MKDEEDPDLDPRGSTVAEVVNLLATGRSRDLVGLAESETVDFKSSLDLSTSKAKRDLAADLAAFANCRGGVLVIGVRTRKHRQLGVEYASEVTGVRPDLLDSEAVGVVSRELCYPPLCNVDVRRYPAVNTRSAQSSIVVIIVEPQAARDSPVLVDRLLEADGTSVPHAAGWPSRVGDATAWTPTARIQQLISTALALRGPVPHSSEVTENGWALAEVLSIPEWQSWSILAVQLTPVAPGVEIPNFYGEFRSGANRWRDVRPHGFGLRLDQQPLQPNGDHLTSGALDRTRLFVSHRGDITVAALGSPDFLGWSLNTESSGQARVILNPYPVVEFVAEAMRFVYGVVRPAMGSAVVWNIRVRGMRLMDPVPTTFVASTGSNSSFASRFDATCDTVDRAVVGTLDWDSDTFRILAALLGSGYGVPESDIPFARDLRIVLEPN